MDDFLYFGWLLVIELAVRMRLGIQMEAMVTMVVAAKFGWW